MNQIRIELSKNVIIAILAIIFLLIFLLLIGSVQNEWKWGIESLSALLGAAIVTAITCILLNWQSKKESDVDKKKKVFDNRVKAYESFLDSLCKVVVKNEVTIEDERMLQFGVATIGIHATSERMFQLSKDLKRIVQKIRVDNPVDGSIWNEIMDIAKMFHLSLYEEDAKEMDNYLKKAIRNFRGLCVNKNHSILEYIECMLSPFDFDTHIADNCLYINIHIKDDKYNELKKLSEQGDNTPNRLYVTLKINNSADERYAGKIAVYTGDSAEKQAKMITTIYDNYWILPEEKDNEEFRKKDKEKNIIANVEMGIMVSKAYVVPFYDLSKEEVYSTIVDVLRYIDQLWDEPNNQYLILCKEMHSSETIWTRKRRKLADFGTNL